MRPSWISVVVIVGWSSEWSIIFAREGRETRIFWLEGTLVDAILRLSWMRVREQNGKAGVRILEVDK